MTTLFDKLPLHLFEPLCSPRGAPVYSEILLALYAATQRSGQRLLSHDIVVNTIQGCLLDPRALELTADALEGDAAAELESRPEADPRRLRANAILRYLERREWLRSEAQVDLTPRFYLPVYAYRILACFDNLLTQDQRPVNGQIYTIYSVLLTALSQNDLDQAIPEIARHTDDLFSWLRELYHNIGTHITAIQREIAVRALLDHLLGDYRREILERGGYHDLRTADHVSRYRPAIRDNLLLIERRAEVPEPLRAEARRVRESFDQMDDLLADIDERNQYFVGQAVKSIRQKVARGATVSGQLRACLEALAQIRDAQRRDDLANSAVTAWSLSVPYAGMAAPLARRAQPFVADPVDRAEIDAEAAEQARQATLERLKNALNPARIAAWAQELLGAQDSLPAREIPVTGPETLVRIMLLRAYSPDGLGYEVEELPDPEWIVQGDVGFRDFVLRRATRRNGAKSWV